MLNIRTIKKSCATLLLIVVSVTLWHVARTSPPAAAQAEGGWSQPVLISSNTYLSWFPDIAVDGDGGIHVIYDTSDVPLDRGKVMPGVMYTVYRDGAWSEPNDLHLGRNPGNIFRPAIAVDRLGDVHWTRSGEGIWYYRAHADTAWSAAAWKRHILDNGATYMSDVALDSQGIIHVVYEKWTLLSEPITRTRGAEVLGLTDIFYRRSSDGGRTWSAPFNLSPSEGQGAFRVQIKVDENDVLHVTWDEGWDRLSAYGEPRESVYIRSTDGGHSWSEPAVFSQPDNTNAQIAAGSDNKGGVLVVWRATSVDTLFYSWSSDGGQTWSPPTSIPGLYARAYNDTDFDAYDMATDSAGHIHLVAVGRPRLPASRADHVPLDVFHLVWDGDFWSEPERIAEYTEEEGFPEYPKLAISEGNKLHVVWFVRDQQYGVGEFFRILYSSSLSDAPYQTPVPIPTPTPTPLPTFTPLPPPTSTPLPTLAPGSSYLPEGLYTESDEMKQLALALLPILLLVVVIAIVRLRR